MTGQLKVADGSSVAPGYSFSNENGTGFIRPGAGQIGVVVAGTQIGYFDSGGFEGSVKAGVPVGTVLDFAGSTAPALWLLCSGQAVSRTTYSALFAAIGTIYGVGDGSTTFNLPDLRGVVIAGLDNMNGTPAGRLTSTYYGANPDVLGTVGGGQSETLTTAQIPAHTHSGTTGAMNSNQAHTHTFTSVQVGGGALSGGSAPSVALNAATGSTTGSTNIDHTHNFTTDNGTGGGTAHPNVQPTIVMNKMIYAGA